MKKFKFAILALAAMVLPLAFVSCGDDENDEPEPPTNGGTKAVSATSKCIIKPNKELLDVFNITYNYLKNGETATGNLHGTTTVVVEKQQVPATFAYRVVLHLKPDVELTKDEYTFELGVSAVNYFMYDKKGNIIDKYSHSQSDYEEQTLVVERENIPLMDGYTLYSTAYKVLDNGSYNMLSDYNW
ncbi:MAG: hypothetical protein ACI30X_02205 [Muribaculaceae bacterium]